MPSKRRPRPSDQNGGEDSAEAEKDAKRLVAADIKAVEVGNSYDGLRAVLQAEVRAMPRATHGKIHTASEEIIPGARMVCVEDPGGVAASCAFGPHIVFRWCLPHSTKFDG